MWRIRTIGFVLPNCSSGCIPLEWGKKKLIANTFIWFGLYIAQISRCNIDKKRPTTKKASRVERCAETCEFYYDASSRSQSIFSHAFKHLSPVKNGILIFMSHIVRHIDVHSYTFARSHQIAAILVSTQSNAQALFLCAKVKPICHVSLTIFVAVTRFAYHSDPMEQFISAAFNKWSGTCAQLKCLHENLHFTVIIQIECWLGPTFVAICSSGGEVKK